MSTRTRIEWDTGISLGYETADELGIGEFVSKKRWRSSYLQYAQVKALRKADNHQLWCMYRRQKDQLGKIDPALHANLTQRVKSHYRNRFWRSIGYPNLRLAWEANRRNAARRRAEKAIAELREVQRQQLKQYQL